LFFIRGADDLVLLVDGAGDFHGSRHGLLGGSFEGWFSSKAFLISILGRRTRTSYTPDPLSYGNGVFLYTLP
jgi:hypothetical protein